MKPKPNKTEIRIRPHVQGHYIVSIYFATIRAECGPFARASKTGAESLAFKLQDELIGGVPITIWIDKDKTWKKLG